MSTKAILITLLATTVIAGAARGEQPPSQPPPPVRSETEATAPPPAATTAVANAGGAPATVPPPAAPYSLPWQLRLVAAASVVRSDTAIAFYDNGAGAAGSTVATMLLASYRMTPSLAPMVRLGFVQNDAPGAAADGKSIVNPIVGVTYARRLSAFRWAAFVGAAVPIGTGGGNTPDPSTAAANAAGIRARSAMDGAMFAVNYLTAMAGGGVAFVDHRWTLQAEATLLQSLRVRGDSAASSTDSARTNSTVGLHAGYFLGPSLSLGVEIRYQRWLSTPTELLAGNRVAIAAAAEDTLTVAAGPRLHFTIGKDLWLRPGIAYARALDQPMSNASYNVIQVDVPLIY